MNHFAGSNTQRRSSSQYTAGSHRSSRYASGASCASTNTLYSDPSRLSNNTSTDYRHSQLIDTHQLVRNSHAWKHGLSQALQNGTLARASRSKAFAVKRIACMHCDTTFTQLSDWKKHFQKSCISLGPGSEALLCASCTTFCRTKNQIQQHTCKRNFTAGGPPSQSQNAVTIEVEPKQYFACVCGVLVTNATLFYGHLAENLCTAYDAKVKTFRDACVVHHPHLDQHSRITGLLGELDISAEVSVFLDDFSIPKFENSRCAIENYLDRLRDVISNEEARDLCNKLEWGVRNPNQSCNAFLLGAGYGFTSNSHLVAKALTPLLDVYGPETTHGAHEALATQWADSRQRSQQQSAPVTGMVPWPDQSGLSLQHYTAIPNVSASGGTMASGTASLLPPANSSLGTMTTNAQPQAESYPPFILGC